MKELSTAQQIFLQTVVVCPIPATTWQLVRHLKEHPRKKSLQCTLQNVRIGLWWLKLVSNMYSIGSSAHTLLGAILRTAVPSALEIADKKYERPSLQQHQY